MVAPSKSMFPSSTATYPFFLRGAFFFSEGVSWLGVALHSGVPSREVPLDENGEVFLELDIVELAFEGVTFNLMLRRRGGLEGVVFDCEIVSFSSRTRVKSENLRPHWRSRLLWRLEPLLLVEELEQVARPGLEHSQMDVEVAEEAWNLPELEAE